MNRLNTILFLMTLCIIIYLLVWQVEALSQNSSPKLTESFFSSLKQTSRQGVGLFKKFAASIPFTKVLLSGGAILSLFFIFIRMLIVIGPILILGAMTRESTDATDFLKMLIEFYNQIVVALDDQASN